jgi:hypothetical protein
MLAEPPGTIYGEADGNVDPPPTGEPGFFGHSDGLYRKGEADGPGWWKVELLAQPLRDGPGTPRRLAIREDATFREVYEDDSEYFYVYDPEDVARLVALLGGGGP